MQNIMSIPSIPSIASIPSPDTMLREAGIHDTTESMCVSGIDSGISYTVIVGNGGLFPAHSHIPALVDRKNIILNHIGHDYEPYFRFAFALEDTLFHCHAAHHIYYCMDDDAGGATLYQMNVRKYEYGKLSPPERCHRTIDAVGHSHTLTLVRHADMVEEAVVEGEGEGEAEAVPAPTASSDASGADPTAP